MNYIYDKLLYAYCYLFSGIMLKQAETEDLIKQLRTINDDKARNNQ